MASLSNNFQLLNGLQSSQKPPAAKKDKKKASPALAAEPAELPPRAPARVTSVEAADLDGFQPAKRSVARSRSGQLASKVSGGVAESSPVSRLIQTIEQGLQGAITPADWLTLWRTWILQLQDQQQSIPSTAAPDFKQALLSTEALEKSAAACTSVQGLQNAEPLSELLHSFLGDSSVDHSELAGAIVELGDTLAAESKSVRTTAEGCLKAVMQHLKSAEQPHGVRAHSATDKQTTALADLDSSITELQAGLTQQKGTAREQSKLAQKLSKATQQRLALLTSASPAGAAAQQAVGQLEDLSSHLSTRLQESLTMQKFKSDALHARAGLLEDEQVALVAEMEELQGRLAQLQHRLVQVQQEQREVSALQITHQSPEVDAATCGRQVDALRRLQVLVASSSSLPDAASNAESGSSTAEAACSFTASALCLLKINLQYQLEVVSKAKFAGERLALAKQQIGHLQSLHFDEEATKAARVASQCESTLTGLAEESRAIVAVSLSAVKAANVSSPALATDTAAPTGQISESLMRQIEELHSQLLHLRQHDSARSEPPTSNGIHRNGNLANGHQHIRTTSVTSEGLSAPSIAASSATESEAQMTNGSSDSSRGAATGVNGAGDASHPPLSKNRRRRKGNAHAKTAVGNT